MNCRYLFIFCLLLGTASAHASWQAWPTVMESASQTAYSYYQQRYPLADIIIDVDAPDPRLKLAHCANNLTYDLGVPPENGGNLSTQVKCEGSQQWSIYLKMKVAIWTDIVVTAQALKRGSQITKTDLRTQRVNLAETRNGTLYNMEEAVGMELRRSLAAAAPLRIRDLAEPMVIKRGDRVQIAARLGGLRVLMPGTALANGRIGEQIAISNDRSDRKVRAKVIAEGQVEVPL